MSYEVLAVERGEPGGVRFRVVASLTGTEPAIDLPFNVSMDPTVRRGEGPNVRATMADGRTGALWSDVPVQPNPGFFEVTDVAFEGSARACALQPTRIIFECTVEQGMMNGSFSFAVGLLEGSGEEEVTMPATEFSIPALRVRTLGDRNAR